MGFVHTGLQEQKSKNYITECRDRLDHAHNRLDFLSREGALAVSWKRILSGAVVLFCLCGKKTETKNGTGR